LRAAAHFSRSPEARLIATARTQTMIRSTHAGRRCRGQSEAPGAGRRAPRAAALLAWAAAALLASDALLAQPGTAEEVLATERALLEQRGATIGRVNIT